MNYFFKKRFNDASTGRIPIKEMAQSTATPPYLERPRLTGR